MTQSGIIRFAHCSGAALMLALVATSPAQGAWETPAMPTSQIAEQNASPAPGVTATVRDPFFKITALDVSNAVAAQLEAQGVVPKAEVTLNGGLPALLYSADHPVKTVIHSLQVDPQTKRWQAQAYFVGGSQTESVKPISGSYGAMVEVPMLTRQFAKTDVIDTGDIEMHPVPERLLRKDTVTDAKSLIGQSPRSGISPNRPIRTTEISPPIVIKRGDLVELQYVTPYMQLKTTGVALEDGAKGSAIRVKNQKSERAVTGRVQSAGHVDVSSGAL